MQLDTFYIISIFRSMPNHEVDWEDAPTSGFIIEICGNIWEFCSFKFPVFSWYPP